MTIRRSRYDLLAAFVLAFFAISAPAQSPLAPVPASAGLASLAWLAGCWQGAVTGREFREIWTLPRGGMMLGVSQTLQKNRTLNFEHLRIETQGEGTYYVISAPGKKEVAFRYQGASDAQGRMTYAFENPAEAFPRRLAYGRGEEGWLYAAVEGKIDNKDRSLVYPMRRIDCQSDEMISK